MEAALATRTRPLLLFQHKEGTESKATPVTGFAILVCVQSVIHAHDWAGANHAFPYLRRRAVQTENNGLVIKKCLLGHLTSSLLCA
eukprot:2853372-Amphidinium_carterae.1